MRHLTRLFFVCVLALLSARVSAQPPVVSGPGYNEVFRFSGSLPSGRYCASDGTNTLPAYSFCDDLNTGAYSSANDSYNITTGGTNRFTLSTATLILTVPLLTADGSAGSVSHGFSSESNTGMYRSAANTLGWSINGTLRLSLNTVSLTSTLPYYGPDGSAAAPGYAFTSSPNSGLALSGGGSNMLFITSGLAAGRATTAGLFAANGLRLGFLSSTLMSAPSDGLLLITNNALTDFNRVQYGGTTSSFPAQKRVGTTLEARLADDSNVASYVSNGATLVEGRLSSTAGIDLSSTAKQTLYTIPAGKIGYITKVMVRDPSAAITLATVTLGCNAASDDVIAAVALTSLSGATKYQKLEPMNGAEECAAGAIFGLDTTVQEAAADTVVVDVFGYIL